MNTYTIQPATFHTLPDLYALLPDSPDTARLLDAFRARLERGDARLSNTLILRTRRGVEGSVIFTPAPHPFVFPHLRREAPSEALTAFLLALRHALSGTPERQLLLDSSRADVPAGPVLEAGWLLDDTQLQYETDLRAHRVVEDSGAQEIDLNRPGARAVLAELNQPELRLREGWRLAGLSDASGDLLALGAVGPTNRPGYANIDLIGVRPGARGQGLGSRLHTHLLALAAQEFQNHSGTTSADNHAMRRIFEKNGSVRTGTQLYFSQP